MAVQFISINSSQRLGSELRTCVSVTRDALERLRQLKEIADKCVDGADYTAFATQFGITPGEAQSAYNLLAGAKARIDDVNVLEFLSRLG